MTTKTADLDERLRSICLRKRPPTIEGYSLIITEATSVLEREPELIRPRSRNGSYDGRPGGIIYLQPDIPTVIVPDLHARMDFIMDLLAQKDGNGVPFLELIAAGLLQVVCVGDGFHSEGRGAARWKKAFEEFASLYKTHANMDAEMREGMGLMEMIMCLKVSFPLHFHFLKGNHENILNERGWGNFPFRKYAYEGAMVLEYVKKFYGDDFLRLYYAFEKSLPLLAIGPNFIISHAEPRRFFDRGSILNYRENPDVVAGLTWTDNGESEDGTVRQMIEYYLGSEKAETARYFGGHRAVETMYLLRAEGSFIQIHNPKKSIIAWVDPESVFDPERDIIELAVRESPDRCC